MENLGIDPKLLLAQLINFVIFFIIVKKFVAKPFLSFLEEERKKEREKAALLEAAQKQDEKLKNKEKEMQQDFKKEMNKIIAAAKSEAEKMKKEIIEEARVEATKIKENAKGDIEAEREKLYKQVKDKVSELSLFIVNQALEESLNTDLRKKVSQKILSSLTKDIDIYEN